MMFFALCISFAQALPQPTLDELLDNHSWKPLKTIQDRVVGKIVVQEKGIDGFPCFRATAKTTASLSSLENVVLDIPSSPRWSSVGLTESVVIEQSDSYIHYYQHISIPIVSNRHWFLQARIFKDTNSVRLVWQPLAQGKHDAVVRKKRSQYPGAVEPIINIGEWNFSQISESQNQVQYSICTHPGGSIPRQFRSIGTIQTLPTNVKEIIMEANRRVQ